MKMRLFLGLAVALLLACESTHVSPYTPKRREYNLDSKEASAEAEAPPGSLWKNGQVASALFTDARAFRENDLVVVKVEELADAKRSADTELNRQSQITAEMAAFVQAAAAANPVLNPKLTANFSNNFDGKGSTARTEKLTATVPALVRKVLPNGSLFIEGHRVVLVNSEEQHFYISGLVRPIDIDQENSIKSSMIADAEIEFTGRGVLTDNQRQGFLSRLLSLIWPF